jgi:pilus assembly protein CpaB
MDRRFLTVLGVSLVFALVVSSVFYQMTARSGSSSKPDASNQKDMVVATRPLSVGVMVKPADVKIAKIGTESFPKGRVHESGGCAGSSGDLEHPAG